MKEVERVSLGGYAFTLDTDAARLAEDYLGELEKHYDGRPGGSDILEGIEERMAELLMEKAGRDGVVSGAMMEDVIRILGRPEDIEAAGEEEAKEEQREEIPGQARNDYNGARNDYKATGESPKRKLYRDMTDKVVAGVCSGLATYFKTDVALFRILFVVFSVVFMFGFWRHGMGWRISMAAPTLYVILWICMPPAKTVRQRWEQRGEDGSVNSIQRSVEAGAKEVENAIRSVGQSPALGEFGSLIGKIFGVALLIVAFTGLFAGGVWGFGSGWLGPRIGDGFFGIGRLYDHGMSELHYYAPQVAAAMTQPGIKLLLVLVCFLPFLGILYGALQLIFGFKPPKWHPGLVIFLIWLLSLCALGILVATGIVSTELLTI